MLRPGMFSLKVYRAEDIPQSKIISLDVLGKYIQEV
jgi:hypothetical protein